MKPLLRFALPLALFLSGSSIRASTVVATPAAGYYKLPIQGGSDNILSLPLTQRSASIGQVSAITSNSLTLAISGLADDVFKPSNESVYYAQFVSGNLAGLCYKILSNHGSNLTLETNGDDLSNHSLGPIISGDDGDLVRIGRYWTVSTVFGVDSTSLAIDPIVSAVAGPHLQSDSVLFPDNDTLGTDKRAEADLSYVTGAGWRNNGDLNKDMSGLEIRPGIFFTVRRHNPLSTQIVLVGYVPKGQFVLRIPAVPAGSETDMALALASPIHPSLTDSGLFLADSSKTVLLPSPSSTELNDVLLDFSDVRRGFSVPADHRFFVLGSNWFEGENSASSRVMAPGVGYLLRLRGTHGTRYWVQNSGY